MGIIIQLACVAALQLPLVVCFQPQPLFDTISHGCRFSHPRIRATGSNAYDEAPRTAPLDDWFVASDLPSSFPPGMPAGLRGEAVRSALRSNHRCIGWNLHATPLEFGAVCVQGRGCLSFLNNKLTRSFLPQQVQSNYTFQSACLLNAKGHVVDLLGVAQIHDECAFLLTSPGHSSSALFSKLNPFVFPLDEIALSDCCSNSNSSAAYTAIATGGSRSCCTIFTLASVHRANLQSTFDTFIAPRLRSSVDSAHLLPSADSASFVSLDNDSSNGASSLLIIVPCTQHLLPSCAAVGYTFCFINTTLGHDIWQLLLVGDTVNDRNNTNDDGPVVVEIGALELETMRIEAGQPAYGKELTGSSSTSSSSSRSNAETTRATAATPLELHLESTVDLDKGCYLGQEGVASVQKNPRGPPRLLYQVVFDDEFNLYSYQQQQSSDNKKRSKIDNLTRIPKPGDKLYVLGSNQEIAVGTITSIAEPGGTGDANTVGLALVRRADSILKQMKAMDLEIPSPVAIDTTTSTGSAMVVPSMPLDGLEVIVGDTFTVGTLKTVTTWRFRPYENMFVDEPSGGDMKIEESSLASVSVGKEPDPKELARALEAKKAEAEAEAAAAEAKRKEQKIEMLRKRAEEALARRKSKKEALDGT